MRFGRDIDGPACRGIVFACIALAAMALARPVQAGDAEAGRKVSEKHCSRCHVVGDFNPMGGISSTPSFQLLVKRRPDYRERFETFYARRPHPAFVSIEGLGRPLEYLPANASPVKLPARAIADILAFVETLKPDG